MSDNSEIIARLALLAEKTTEQSEKQQELKDALIRVYSWQDRQSDNFSRFWTKDLPELQAALRESNARLVALEREVHALTPAQAILRNLVDDHEKRIRELEKSTTALTAKGAIIAALSGALISVLTKVVFH